MNSETVKYILEFWHHLNLPFYFDIWDSASMIPGIGTRAATRVRPGVDMGTRYIGCFCLSFNCRRLHHHFIYRQALWHKKEISTLLTYNLCLITLSLVQNLSTITNRGSLGHNKWLRRPTKGYNHTVSAAGHQNISKLPERVKLTVTKPKRHYNHARVTLKSLTPDWN